MGAWVLVWVVGLRAGFGADSSDTIVRYLERYHQLGEKDVAGRLALADWCSGNEMFQQQADLLTEVLKLDPKHAAAYRDLLEVDGKRSRAVEGQWAGKLSELFGPSLRLYHAQHFTLVTDTGEPTAAIQGQAMEETYRSFYVECVAIGLRPMPPEGRLVCVLFEQYEGYVDYLERFEGMKAGWASGYYSWRTNRVAFFHDRDNPVFKEVREQIAGVEQRIGELRSEMQTATATARRIEIQEQLKRLNAQVTDLNGRLTSASRLATLGKTRHEATHQLLYNSGLLRRGREYPFWLSEGLAMCFELCDAEGHAGPKFVNRYRLRSYRDAEKAGQLHKLGQLIREQPGDGEDVTGVARRYAEAWALVQFLWNKRPEELRSYVETMNADGGGGDAAGHFCAYFGEDMEAIERQLRKYVDSL